MAAVDGAQGPPPGRDVRPASGVDAGQAARWFDRAAKQGYTLAQSNLAAMYGSGQGVQKDMGKAYFWLAIAHAKDPSLQSRMQTAEQALSPAERLKVQREVRNWKPGKE